MKTTTARYALVLEMRPNRKAEFVEKILARAKSAARLHRKYLANANARGLRSTTGATGSQTWYESADGNVVLFVRAYKTAPRRPSTPIKREAARVLAARAPE